MYFGISFVFLRCFIVYHLEFISGVFFVRLGLGFQVHELFCGLLQVFPLLLPLVSTRRMQITNSGHKFTTFEVGQEIFRAFFKTTDRYFLGFMRHVRDRLLSSSGHVLMGHRFWSEDLLVPTLGSLACGFLSAFSSSQSPT